MHPICAACSAEKYLLLFDNPSNFIAVPKSSGDKKRPDTSPVVARAAIHQRQQLQKANQALQVPAVALYPSRKKVPVKDLPPFGKPKSKPDWLVYLNQLPFTGPHETCFVFA